MKVTLNVLDNHPNQANRHWPAYILRGRVRTSSVVLIVAFLTVWWAYDTYRPAPRPAEQPATQVVPPGFVPDPNYTWVPRTRVQQPVPTNRETPTTTTEPTTTPPPTTTAPTTTTPPPLFQLPVLPPPFGPGTASSTAPPESSPAPGPQPIPAPGPLPGVPPFGR